MRKKKWVHLHKRLFAFVLAAAVALQTMGLEAFAAEASGGGGAETEVTRLEWLKALTSTFGFTVEEDNYPDNYYADIDADSEDYHDVMLATEFGLVDVEAGGELRPDDAATREFAAHTLNLCLGYAPEGDGYGFSEAEDVTYPDDIQAAVDHGWFALEGGKFLPEQAVTETEQEAMLADVKEALDSTEISADHENDYRFAEGVIVLPEDIAFDMGEDGTITIYGYAGELQAGDEFALYVNGIPAAYQAESVSETGDAMVVEATEVASEDALEYADAQGSAETDLRLAEAAEGVTVTYIAGGTEEKSFTDGRMYSAPRQAGNQKIKAVKAAKTLELSNGVKAQFTCTLSGMTVDYKINAAGREAYVSLNGLAEMNCNVSVDVLKGAGIPSNIELVHIPIGGVGAATVSVDYQFDGKLALAYTMNFSEGVQYTAGGGFREVHKFQKKSFTVSSEANMQAGVTAALEISGIPFVHGRVYAKTGAKTHITSDTYNDGKSPNTCLDISSYLYASGGASLSCDFLPEGFSRSIAIYDEGNSPVRVVYHYEDKRWVSVCTRNPGKYYTSFDSVYGCDGYGDGTGVNGAGEIFAIYSYELDEDGNATITGFRGNGSALMIPSELDGHTVVAIGNDVFKGKGNLRSVLIPDTVTKIGSGAFSGCANLGNVTLSKNLADLGCEAFGDCESLTEIEIPKSLETCHVGYDGIASYYNGPFNNCEQLGTVRFEEGTKQIAKRLFAGCTGLKTITIPDTATTIGERAFRGCVNLTAIEIPESVTTIEVYAFTGCSSLASAKIGNGVTKIEALAFANCKALSEVELSKNLEELGADAFLNCVSLTEIEIPKKLASCPDYYDGFTGVYRGAAFENCESLETVRFEEGTKQIVTRLFEGCTGLRAIEIPESVTVIGTYAFEGCSNLTSVKIGNGVTKIEALAFANCEALSEATLPKNLVELGAETFRNCVSLTEIEIPKSLEVCADFYDGFTHIYHGAPFNNCESLETVRFEEGEKKIVRSLFAGCTGLKEIAIPNTVKTVEERAFEGCVNLTAIEIPESVTSIEKEAFNGCSSLTSATIADSVTKFGSDLFAGCSSLSSVKLSKNQTEITGSMFKDCTSLESIALPDGIERISASAFEGSGLKEIQIPEKTAVIGNNAFKNSALEKAAVSDGVQEIGSSAFYGCVNLTDVTLGKGLGRIGDSAFYGCDLLAKISIPSSVTSMGAHIFEECDVLSDVSLGTGVTAIPEYAFHQCAKLTEIVLPYRVAEVKDHAFTNCVKLASVTVPQATEKISAAAFSYPGNMTIYGISGSYAETYANENGIAFQNRETPAEQAELSLTEWKLAKGAKKQLFLTVAPIGFTDKVSWKSGNPEIATVSGDGEVQGVSCGTTAIKVTAGSASASCTVTVTQPVRGINLSRTSATMAVGETLALEAEVYPDDATDKSFRFSSSAPEVASVSESGEVRALAKGEAEIIAEALDGSGVTAKCSVRVTSQAVVATDVSELKSPHPYENDCADSWIYTKEGASRLFVTFHENTKMEDGFDYLYLYGKDGELVGEYTGSELAGETVQVEGDTVRIKLETDEGGTAWGFEVTEVSTDEPGMDPGEGDEPGTDPGEGDEPGTDPGEGDEPGTDPGEEENPSGGDEENLFPTVDGQTVSLQADPEKKATVLVFGRTTCASTASTLKEISQSEWIHNSDVKVIFAEAVQADKDEVQAFISQNGCDEIVACYDTGQEINSVLWDYVRQGLGGVSSVGMPIVVLLDRSNTVQNVLTGFQDADDLLSEIRQFAEISDVAPDTPGADPGDTGTGLNVEQHTKEEIRAYLAESGAGMQDALTFEEEPTLEAPYAPGKLSEQTLDAALRMLNQIRYIAGIPYQVQLADILNEEAQAASLVNYANGKLSHTPTQPSGMDDALYSTGYAGAQTSNIAMTFWEDRSLNDTLVNSWMEDGDNSNIDRVGHRRWILNPSMGYVGFGAVSGEKGTYSAVSAHDMSNQEAGQSGVAWPAQNMPISYFDTSYPWSVSMGTDVDMDEIQVTLVRRGDQKTWKFSSESSDGYFNVNNDWYGQTGCIIFRPEMEDGETYADGDTYDVEITGLPSGNVSYSVNFFDLESSGEGDDPGTTPGEGDDPGTTPGEGGDPGTTPGEGGDPGTTPGEGGDPGTTPGEGGDPGTTPGEGEDPGTTPGEGGDPGTTPGEGGDPGTTPGEGGDPGTGDVPGVETSTEYTYRVDPKSSTATITGCESSEETITIPSKLGGYPVTAIGEKAFRGVTSMKAVVFPSTLKEIGVQAFRECTSLESVTLPNSLYQLGYYAFRDCTALKSANMGQWSGNVVIGLFYGCKSLTSVSMPKVKNISLYAFGGCSALREVSLPASLKYVFENAFLNSGIKSIRYAGTSANWKNVIIYPTGNASFLNATVTGSDGKTFSANKSKWKTTVTVKKPSVPKVSSFKAKPGKKRLTLSWKKVSGAAGYQVQVSLKKNFKGAKTISVSKSKKSYTKKGLKAKKKYYVRIRAYKTYKDARGKTQKAYGKWATVNKKTK